VGERKQEKIVLEESMTDIVPYLEEIRTRFEQPEARKLMEGKASAYQLVFPDLQRDFALCIAEDGSATVTEERIAKPDATITINSDTLAGILDKKVNPLQAFITRKIKVNGNVDNLLKLRVLY
jgi:putative sterol carrier protein